MVAYGISNITIKKIKEIQRRLQDTLQDEVVVEMLINDISKILRVEDNLEYKKAYYRRHQEELREGQRKRSQKLREDPQYCERERAARRERYARQKEETVVQKPRSNSKD